MIEQAIKQVLQDTVLALWPEIQTVNFTVELPKNPDHGDYATNLAMVLTKLVGMPPREVAGKLISNLKDPVALIESADIAGPGFINFRVSNAALQKVAVHVLEQGAHYGVHPQNGQKVLIEFVSANPTGPLHLGHARPAFLGDGVARILKAAGFDVTREFYINDAGNQVQTLGKTVYARYQELFGRTIELGKDSYPGEYVIEIARKLKALDGDKWLDRDDYLPRCIEVGIAENLANIKETLKSVGIEFDSWYSEQSLHDKNAIEHAIERYRERGMLYEASEAEGTSDKVRREESKSAQYAHQQIGGTFLKTSQFGDEEDRIILRKDGTSVYLAADIAYHQEKFERGFDRLIDVFGADHAGHVPRMRACMRALGLDDKKLDFLLVQMVKLLKDGQEMRFSKRSGQIIELKEFIEEVGIDVARVVFLMRSPNTQFDFDLNLALSQSSDNPVFYLQYGHARMATILSKAEFLGVNTEALKRLVLPEERNMLKKMAAYPDVILTAAHHMEPHRVLFYCQDLIGEFHAYFTQYRHSEKIISDDVELTQGRLALVSALKQVLANALSLLGISAPESMHA
ncbi:MAG: arginine--tRNA ligase [Myxococcota bacterium]